VLLLAVGLFLGGQAAFASSYVAQQLGDQKIAFPTADKITDAEKTWKPGSACLLEFAGQDLQNGRQAECYANYFIAEHMAASAKTAGYPGATYATIGAAQGALRTEIAEAKAAKNDAKAADSQKKLDAVTALRETMFKGEMLRSALLTTYGFSVIGSVAGTVSALSYGAAALFVILGAIAFFRSRVPAVAVQRPAPAPVTTR
jgi:hypothetical protein